MILVTTRTREHGEIFGELSKNSRKLAVLRRSFCLCISWLRTKFEVHEQIVFID